ncbi:YcaO-like family protein [Bacillus licheniformis]|nr:YcaO-like family protein [Bacillus licheniformis]
MWRDMICMSLIQRWNTAFQAFGRSPKQKREGLNLICSAGAHPDPVKAVKSALHELAGMMLKHDRKFESERSKYHQMLRSPALVREMEDHSLMYGLPEAEERLSFC